MVAWYPSEGYHSRKRLENASRLLRDRLEVVSKQYVYLAPSFWSTRSDTSNLDDI